MKQIYILYIGIFIVSIIAISIFFYKKDNFDITVDPVRNEYMMMSEGCSESAQPVSYGLNMEHDNNIDMCSFIKQINKGDEFVNNVNQDACDIPSRQICQVLYQYHQEYFQNMWSGFGECEIYQKEQCKKCPPGLIKISQN